jgi:predicted DNA-binding antitoxin AbrB/MazE fold protein
MSQVIRAVFEGGVLRPLDHLDLPEQQQVRVTVELALADAVQDPLAGCRVATGIPDLAEHFDDYRFGRRKP